MIRFVGLSLLLSLVACSNPSGFENLAFEGRSTVAQTTPMTVETVVTVRNTGDRTAQVQGNTCGRPILGFTTPERIGTPAWSSPLPVACPAYSQLISIGPGDSYDLHFEGTIPPSVPPGVYYLAVDVGIQLVPAGQFVK